MRTSPARATSRRAVASQHNGKYRRFFPAVRNPEIASATICSASDAKAGRGKQVGGAKQAGVPSQACITVSIAVSSEGTFPAVNVRRQPPRPPAARL
jgi:hypothetical protein